MGSQALEQILVNTFTTGVAKNNMYQTIDAYAPGTTALYSSGKSSKPSLTIRDFPASKVQLHIHEGQGGTAHWRTYDRQDKIPMSSYDAAMADATLPSDIKKIQK